MTMPAETQKRFRKRGGAKKKKRPKDSGDGIDQRQQGPTLNHHSNFASPNYFAGFTGAQDHRLDDELDSYLRKLQDELETLDPGAEIATNWQPDQSEDVPPSVLLAQNALKDLSSRINEIARDNFAARIIEALLRCVKDAEALTTFFQAILDCGPSRVAEMAMHRCASHVLQTSINALRQASNENVNSVIGNLGTTISAWTDEELLDVIRNTSGSHVFRTIIGILSGLPDDEPREARLDDSSPEKIESYIDTYRKDVPDEWLRSVHSVGMKILESSSLPIIDLLWEPASCTALQALLSGLAVRDRSAVKRFGQRAIEADFDSLIHHSCGSRFLERLILILGFDFVKTYAKGRLAEFASHPKANFCLQRVLFGLKGRGQVMSAWDELETSLPQLVGRGRAREGVVLALLRVTEAEGDENCRRKATRALIKAFGATGKRTSQLAGILAFGSEETWDEWRNAVRSSQREDLGMHGKESDELRVPYRFPSPQLLGTLMARCLMRFPGGPGQAARDSMAILTPLELLVLSGNPIGSRLVEQWIGDTDLERSSKNAARLLKAAKEGGSTGILALAKNPYGARVLIKCVQQVSVNERKAIMDGLASFIEALKSHESGQVVIRKCRVEQYMRRGVQWERQETGRETRQRLFSDIINDDLEENVALQGKKENNDTLSNSGNRKRGMSEGLQKSGTCESQKSLTAVKFMSKIDSRSLERLTDDLAKEKQSDESDHTGLAPVLSAIETIAKPKKSKKEVKKKRRKLLHSSED